MKEHKSKVGKNLIGMLMFQMYGDSKLIYREYVQNARDAINDAVKNGILSKITDGHIVVNIDSNNRTITITDNGTGVSVDRVEPVLLDIADSDKDGETSAGQFGIGRLVGGYFCKKLSFKTSYKGEDLASEIVFDIDKIKAILDDENDRRTAPEVIDTATDKNIYEEDRNRHYFIVTLEDIHPDYPELLNSEIISEYLKEVAPVDYNPAFKNQLIQTSVKDEYVEHQKQIGHFRISVNDEVSIKKRYGLNIEGTGDQIISLNYFSLPDDTHGLLAWGWYALTEFSRAIPSSDKNSCFRLRKHNIQVGDSSLLTDLFPRNETRGNKYFYGEIHIVNQKIKLNSARDGLAPTPEAECLKQRIRDYFDHLVKLYHLANDMKKATEKAIEASTEQTTALPVDIPEVTKKWDEATKKITSIENSKNAQSAAAMQMIESYKKKINEAIKIIPDPQPTPPAQQPPTIPPTNTSPDPLAALRGNYPADKIELIKRVLKSFTDNCPISQKKLIEELKKKVIKDLGR
jgi:molecular chaperone HtpG